MSVRKVSSSTTPYTTGLGVKVSGKTPLVPWVRNKSWLTFTAPTASEQKFIGLHAVWPEANFLALSASGNYTVDWGDGVVENFTSDVTAQHEYDFADADLANTNAPVTLQGAADTVTRSSHGYSNGDIVRLYNIVTTTGISANTPYYVVNATTDTFQLSLTRGGAAIDLVNDGSATLLPYKQAIVQVYPQAGQNLTALNLAVRHSSVSVAYSSGFLDIALAGASLTDFRLGSNVPGALSSLIVFSLLEKVNLVRSDCRQLSSLFYNCTALQHVVDLATSETPVTSVPVTFTDSTNTVDATAHGFRNGDPVFFTSITSTTGISTGTLYFVVNATANAFQVASSYGGSAINLINNGSGVAVRSTALAFLFTNCSALQSVPLFNTAAVTNMSGMFQSCYVLQSVPLFNTAAVTNMTSMFQSCYALQSVPLFNTAAVTNMSFMFNNCYALQSVPLFNTAAVTNMSFMFNNCYALQSVPLFNTAAVTNMSSMFNTCTSLQSVPLFNTAAVTNMSGMFQTCSALQSVPLFNTAAVTNMSSMFQNCRSLQYIHLFNTAAVTSMSSMFQSCSSLQSVPLFNTAAVTNMSAMFSACFVLQSVPLFNTAAVTNMSSMFSSCTSLQSVPLFNTAAVTTSANMFNGCTSLQSVPLFNTAAVTNMNTMFNNCTSLQSVPAINTTAVTASANFNSMFQNCSSLSRIQAKDFRFTFSVASCKLSATALNEIYTNLPTVTGQTITVTGNYGTAGDDPAIATAKGWTVTG
jgi:surface protein